MAECGRLEAVIISCLRHLRDRYLHSVRGQGDRAVRDSLRGLPVDMQLYILSFLSPQDLIQLGMTNHYWHLLVQDRLLWRCILLRDLPTWSSIEWKNAPDLDILYLSTEEKSHDYMLFYLKNCPQNRKFWRPRDPNCGEVPSCLLSEHRFAMFGPGLKKINLSLYKRITTSRDLVMNMWRALNPGIGWACTFEVKLHKIMLLVLTLRQSLGNQQDATITEMFLPTPSGQNTQDISYTLTPQLREVCKAVEGFIYVANAESDKTHDRKDEIAQILAMADPKLESQRSPLLILSCVTQPEDRRIPCVYMAHELCLNRFSRPWMVQDTDASTLSGFTDALEWILSKVEPRKSSTAYQLLKRQFCSSLSSRAQNHDPSLHRMGATLHH